MSNEPSKNSDGSAEWEAGVASQSIKSVCSVNGPIEAKIRDELPQQASIELVYRRNVGLPMIREQLIQDKLYTCSLSVLRRELIPRSLVQVVVQSLEAWSEPAESAFVAEISEAINCLNLALLRSGVPMSGLVVARSYYIDTEGNLHASIVPPALGIQCTVAVAYTFTNGEIDKLVMCEASGQSFTAEQMSQVLAQAREDCALLAAKQAKLI